MSVELALNATAQWLNDHAVAVVLALAALTLLAEGVFHTSVTRRDATHQWMHTWLVNIGLLGSALLVSWSLAPWLSPAYTAAMSNESGLLNLVGVPALSYPLHVLAGVLLLDLLAYGIHRALHAVPLFWRFHQVHHSDEHMNASTHFRQHPVQMLAVSLAQLPALWMLGIPAVSWVFYFVIGAAVQLWQHSTFATSASFERVERVIRRLIVTPAMHRVHHDAREQFHNANYAAVFPLWDRLFRSYRSSLRDSRFGLPLPWNTGDECGRTLLDCLMRPFRASKAPALAPNKSRFQTRPQGKS